MAVVAHQRCVFDGGAVFDGPHAENRLDRLRGRGVSGRGEGRRFGSRSNRDVAALRRNLLTATASPFPSCEEDVGAKVERRSIKNAPINLSVFVRAGPVVASFLRGEMDGRGGGDGVSAVNRGPSGLVTSLVFEFLPQEQRL